jgi:hypothetical protein
VPTALKVDIHSPLLQVRISHGPGGGLGGHLLIGGIRAGTGVATEATTRLKVVNRASPTLGSFGRFIFSP